MDVADDVNSPITFDVSQNCPLVLSRRPTYAICNYFQLPELMLPSDRESVDFAWGWRELQLDIRRELRTFNPRRLAVYLFSKPDAMERCAMQQLIVSIVEVEWWRTCGGLV
jgi:hypothetical protein